MSGVRGGRWPRWVAVIVIMAAAVVGLPPALNAVGKALIVEDPLRPAGAILVLGGETRQGDRVAHAVRLYQQGLASMLVVSGTPMGFRTHEAEVMRRHAEFLGVPAERILAVKHNADSTLEEAGLVVPVLRSRGVSEVILVTSNYHTARAKRIFTKAAGPSGPTFLASPVHESSFDPDTWWTRRRDARTFVYESIKTVWSAIED